MISRWISGRLLADHEPELERAAGYLRDLHARLRAAEAEAAGALDRAYDPLVHARASLAAASAPGWIRRIADASVWAPPSVTVCHNDLNPWNLIETADGTWITLDWEWVGRNDPLFDVVGLHQGCGYREAALPRLAEAIIGEPPEPGRLGACLTAFWLREYGWAEAEVAGGNRRAEIVAQRDLGMRKLRALHPPSPR